METKLILYNSSTNSSGLSTLSNTTTESSNGEETLKWTNAEIARLIHIIIRPILIILGTVGNCLTFFIMRKTSLKDVSSCFYMAVLALADTMILWSGCFVFWMVYITNYKIHPDMWTDCKLGQFLFYFGRQYSSMLLVLMSAEKCFAVYFPLKSKTVCTVRTAKWATGIVAVILSVYNLQWFVFYESEFSRESGHYMGVPTEHYHISFDFIDSVLYSFGPFALMSVTNFAIIFKFIKAKCKLSNSTESKCKSSSTESTNQALAKSATRGTAMVVTVSVTFLLLTAPTAVYDALSHFINMDLYHAFMNLTQYLNHSINGVLYIIVGSRFRQEFLNIFYRKKNHKTSSHSIKSMSPSSINGSRN